MTSKNCAVVLAFVSVAVLALIAAPAPAEAGWCAYVCSCSSSCSTVCQVATTNGTPGCRTRAECGYEIVDTTCGGYGTCSGAASCSSATLDLTDVADEADFLDLLLNEETPATSECRAPVVS